MTTPDDTLTPGEDRHADNELKKLRLELEHGAKFFEGSTKASPELMGDWLDHVANYEAQHKNARMLTVYTYVGQPNFRDETDLTDEEIGPELERLLQLMADNDVVLDVLAPEDYDDRTLYRFVTEELFIEGTDDIRIPGSFKHFTYEEFHPNPRYDVVNRCAEFIELLAKGNFDKLTWGMDSPFYDRTQSPHGFKARPEVRQKLDELVARWHPMVILDGFAHELVLGENDQTARAALQLHLGHDGQPAAEVLEGHVDLRHDDGWWMITRVAFGEWVLE